NILKKEKGFKANLVHTFSNFSISNILKAYNKKIKKDLFLNGSLTNVFSKNKFEIQNSKFSIFNEQREISTFNLLLHNNLFNVYKLKINNQKNPIDIKGWINFNKKPIIGFVNIKSDKFKFDIISNITNETIGIIINRRLHATINFNEKHVYFRAKKFKIPINGNNTEINFSFDLNLNTNSIRENRISINKMNIFKGETGNLTAKMNLKNNILTIKDLKYQDNSNEIIGKLVHEIKLKDKIIINGKGFFTDDAKEESYSLDYEIIDSDINAKLYVTHMDIKKIIKKKIDGFINSRLSIYGPVKNPNYNLELDISRGNYLDNDLNAFFIINKNDNDLNIKKASISIAQNRISLKDSIIHFGEDNLKNIAINGSIHIEGLQKILKTNFLLKGDFNSITDEKSPINIDLELENTTVGYLKALDLTNVEKFLPIKLNIARKNKTMILKNYGDKFIYATKHENDVVIKFYNKDETVFETIIDISDGNLDGKAKFLKFPVNAVQKILVPFVGINEGLIDGEIEIKGKHKHPEFYGKLNLFYGVVSLPDYLQVPVINITGIIIADKDKLLVRNVNAEVKKGLVHGYGEILFNGWKFERYLFHLNSDSIPCLIKQGPIDAKGIGYIEDFIFEGKPKNFNFIADLVIESADINLASLMGVNKKRNLMKFPINVFIKFKSGKKVKVNYPIIKGIVKPGEIFTFKYIGEESRAFLGGNVNLKKGDLYYLDKTFKIEQASFQFFEDEIRINPNVNLKAYNRTKDSKGDAVKIYLTMNNRLIPFETTFSSFPYKTQEEISGLLGLSYAANTQEDKLKNILDEELKDTANIETLVNTTNYLSNSFIFTPIENRIRKVTGLDTFSMNTNFLGNIIKSNTTYYTNSLDLLDDSSITLGKYIFNELYFEFMTSFDKKTDATEQLFLPLPNQNYGLNFELMLQLELQYLLIGYTFLPKDYSDLLNAEHLISLEANFKL
ncbi:MAG: translocation/assembly module TamB domain-containing protein, partial [Spirochaetes bacterium]|nr:translocation/assembly module TamB domain-containing protein [Spirochaetota bacterium]